MKVIETTIIATMCVHDERPAMDADERSHVEEALAQAVRTTLFNSFLQYDDGDSGALVASVTVTFSGYISR